MNRRGRARRAYASTPQTSRMTASRKLRADGAFYERIQFDSRRAVSDPSPRVASPGAECGQDALGEEVTGGGEVVAWTCEAHDHRLCAGVGELTESGDDV